MRLGMAPDAPRNADSADLTAPTDAGSGSAAAQATPAAPRAAALALRAEEFELVASVVRLRGVLTSRMDGAQHLGTASIAYATPLTSRASRLPSSPPLLGVGCVATMSKLSWRGGCLAALSAT